MAIRKALVLGADGGIERLQAGDVIEGAVSDQSFPAVNGSGSTLSEGQVVYVKVGGAGAIDLADNSAKASSKAIGVVKDASVASLGTTNILTDGLITIADWTNVAGTPELLAGVTYFLGTAGGITTVATSTAGSSLVTIGTAINATTLEVSITKPILL